MQRTFLKNKKHYKMCFKTPKCDGIPTRRCDGSFEDGDEVLHLPGANLPPGGWDGLGEMEVVGHFTVHGLSVSVSVNTGAGGGVQANINTNNNVIDAMTSFLQATMNPNTVDVHDATINFVNAFMNADNNTTAALNFLSMMAGLPNPATDAEPVPAPALEAVSEAQEDEDEEEEEEEAELAEEITVMAEEALDRVETGRDALGDNEEEEESGAVELALDNVGGQGNAEIEVDETSPPPSPASNSSSNNSFANCCGLM